MVTARPPRNAASGKVNIPSARDKPGISVAPSTMTNAAANAAPEETPIKPGSASGLRNRPCIAAPAAARPAPVSTPISTRGRRIANSTLSCCGVKAMPMSMPMACSKIAVTSRGAMANAPLPDATMMVHTSSSASAPSTVAPPGRRKPAAASGLPCGSTALIDRVSLR